MIDFRSDGNDKVLRRCQAELLQVRLKFGGHAGETVKEWVRTDAHFLAWGVSEGDSMAILELVDGSVRMAPPEKVRFVI